MAYLVKPFSRSDLVPAIEMAVSRFTELTLLEREVADLTDRLETRKAVDRAKGVLQKDLGLTEPDAFRWIQKTAMDLRLSMRQVADGLGPCASLTFLAEADHSFHVPARSGRTDREILGELLDRFEAWLDGVILGARRG